MSSSIEQRSAMVPRYGTISFLTDYGTVDESVGVVKSVLRSIAPHALVIDITHEVPPFDVRAGSVSLIRSAEYLAPGVVLAVVDPGVGTDRRAIAVEVGDGDSVLVGPDNGLLAPVVAMVGGASRVVELTNPAYQLDSPGATFAGRDVFAPAVAHLCNGVDLAELGGPIDPATLVPALIPFSIEEDGVLHGDVLYVDRYGNAHLNIAPDQLEAHGERVVVKAGDQTFTAQRVRTFGDLSSMQAGVVVDDVGMLALVLDQASAADAYGLSVGSSLTMHRSL